MKAFLIVCMCITSSCVKARIPYFAKTVGQNKMYAYTSKG